MAVEPTPGTTGADAPGGPSEGCDVGRGGRAARSARAGYGRRRRCVDEQVQAQPASRSAWPGRGHQCAKGVVGLLSATVAERQAPNPVEAFELWIEWGSPLVELRLDPVGVRMV